MLRPVSPAGMSDTGKAADHWLLDCVESLEVLWVELEILDELCRVTGARDPYSEADELAPVWAVQRRAVDDLKRARDLVLGVRRAVSSRTGLASEERAERKRKLADAEKISEEISQEGLT